MSGRGARPKIVSFSSTEPAALPSREVTLSSMPRPLAARLGRRGCSPARFAERARLRSFLRQHLLHGVADGDPPTLCTRNCALDQDQAALDVGLHNLEIERCDPLDAEVARHLL